MKLLIVLSLLISSSLVAGQAKIELSNDNGEIIHNIDFFESDTLNEPAIFLNLVQVHKSILKSLNQQNIESVNVERGLNTVNGKTYNGKLVIRTKAGYQPKLISLTNLKLAQSNLNKNTSVIFQIDNEVVYENYDSIFIDEQFISKIDVSNLKDKDNTRLIKINTNPDDN